ncbi:hypothetical protein ABRT01_02080 [Lentibacillus sp. L22]|uniref:hypothetical protein n=1 Tax=Lentibacillus TaxID=175304 RepID=UPI0022B1032D|nr:hypothetical protein [Lentibacillus daqui]
MKHDLHHIYETCKQHMHAYVLVEMADGSKVDGIITGLDDEYVYLAVPIDQREQEMSDPWRMQQYGYGPEFGYGYGYPGYGNPGYYGPPRRFRRLILPLTALVALSILPWY